MRGEHNYTELCEKCKSPVVLVSHVDHESLQPQLAPECDEGPRAVSRSLIITAAIMTAGTELI